MMTFSLLARTKQLLLVSFLPSYEVGGETYYARGNDSFKEDMTSAMQMVADLETPTRQWTNVADLSALPASVKSSQSLKLMCIYDTTYR